MKKIFLTVAAALTLAACADTNPNAYTLKGSVENLAKGDTVVMMNMQTKAADTTLVAANGSFKFRGVADSVASRVRLFFKPAQRETMPSVPMNSTVVYLEPGTINAVYGEEIAISGTPLNDAMALFNDSISTLNSQMKELVNVIRDEDSSAEEKEQAKATFDALQKTFPQIVKYFVEQNCDNLVGVDLFARFYRYFEPQEVEELIACFSQEMEQCPEIVKVKEANAAAAKTAVGQPFIDIEMPSLDGKVIKLSDIVAANKLTLVDFWASWCGPCRAEMPNVVNAYEQYKSKGLEIVGVSLDSDKEAWEKAVKELGITWPQMSDVKGWGCAGSRAYAVDAIPATVLIAQDGTIVARKLRGDALVEKLGELLK